MDELPVAYPKDVLCGYLCIHPETGEECVGYKLTPDEEAEWKWRQSAANMIPPLQEAVLRLGN